MSERDVYAEAGVITCDEAEQIAARYNNSHWYKTNGGGEMCGAKKPRKGKRGG